MKVAKILCHYGIDKLFRYTFGSDLLVLDFGFYERYPEDEDSHNFVNPITLNIHKETGDKLFSGAAVKYCVEKYLSLKDIDLWIVDDVNTGFLIHQLKHKTSAVMWYCHGDYTLEANPHNDFNRYFLSEFFSGAPVIAASNKLMENTLSWFKTERHGVVPIAVTPERFTEAAPDATDRFAIVRNELAGKARLYQCYDFVARLVSEFPQLNIYGANFEQDFPVGANIKPYEDVRKIKCAVGLEALKNYSPSFSQLDLMAAGIPVISFPREFIPRAACMTADTEDEFVGLIQDGTPDALREFGAAGKKHVVDCHAPEAWSQAVRKLVS